LLYWNFWTNLFNILKFNRNINSWSVDQEIRIFLFHAINLIIRSWPAVVSRSSTWSPGLRCPRKVIYNFITSLKTWMIVRHGLFLYLQPWFWLLIFAHSIFHLWLEISNFLIFFFLTQVWRFHLREKFNHISMIQSKSWEELLLLFFFINITFLQFSSYLHGSFQLHLSIEDILFFYEKIFVAPSSKLLIDIIQAMLNIAFLFWTLLLFFHVFLILLDFFPMKLDIIFPVCLSILNLFELVGLHIHHVGKDILVLNKLLCELTQWYHT